MTEGTQYIPVVLEELLSRVVEMKQQNCRLAQIHCTVLKDGEYSHEINYSFARGLELINMRLLVNEDQVLPSISVIYPAAFLYENEIHDLFGLKVANMSIDYKGKLYTMAVPTPFKPAKTEEGGQANG